jgi:hypothetical protein
MGDCITAKIDGEKRTLFKPEMGKDYFLGYHNHSSSIFAGSKSVYGVYFGITENNYGRSHLFLSKNDNGELETYVSEVVSLPKHGGYCKLMFWSDGEDDPAISAIDACISDIKLRAPETKYALNRIDEIYKKKKIDFEERLRQFGKKLNEK